MNGEMMNRAEGLSGQGSAFCSHNIEGCLKMVKEPREAGFIISSYL